MCSRWPTIMRDGASQWFRGGCASTIPFPLLFFCLIKETTCQEARRAPITLHDGHGHNSEEGNTWLTRTERGCSWRGARPRRGGAKPAGYGH
ncbi:DUF3489 domain-containing protein [Sesbania bispinosa]|nr:DUF3489 domain-containing protein [Sesbania bispinosa]